jgi:hypothetical protein
MADFDSSLPIRTENPADVAATIVDSTGANNWEVDANGIGQVNLNDGTNALVINGDGSVNANIVQAVVGDELHIYDTASAIAPNTPTDVIDYTVTALKTLILKQFQAACSGKAKVEVKVGPAASELTVYTGFISTASGQVEVKFAQPIEVVAGDKVLVTVTNKDNANTDLYAFINGNEV